METTNVMKEQQSQSHIWGAPVTKCNVCRKPTTDRCGRCNKVYYCSKDCQKKQWSSHKKTCLDPETAAKFQQFRCEKFLECASKQIYGNVMIMAAHKMLDETHCTINITIDETIDEFIAEGSFHIAHLKFDRSGVSKVDSKPEETVEPVKTEDTEDTKKYTVCMIYTLKDYRFTLNGPLPDDFMELKKQEPCPDDEWSIMFEL